MIVRFVFVRLNQEPGVALSLAELAEAAQQLSTIEDVRGVEVGWPADAAAESAWDLTVVLRFDDAAAVERFLQDARQDAFQRHVLEPCAAVFKAWNFEVPEP